MAFMQPFNQAQPPQPRRHRNGFIQPPTLDPKPPAPSPGVGSLIKSAKEVSDATGGGGRGGFAPTPAPQPSHDRSGFTQDPNNVTGVATTVDTTQNHSIGVPGLGISIGIPNAVGAMVGAPPIGALATFHQAVQSLVGPIAVDAPINPQVNTPAFASTVEAMHEAAAMNEAHAAAQAAAEANAATNDEANEAGLDSQASQAAENDSNSADAAGQGAGGQGASGTGPGDASGASGGGGGGGDGNGDGDGDGDGDGGGGGSCFVADTPILMADWTTKPIAEIVVGDMVMSFDEAGDLRPGRVIATKKDVVPEVLVFDDGMSVTPKHRFLTPEGFVPIVKAETGITHTGEEKPLPKFHHWAWTNPHHEVYNFTVEDHHTYIANGWRVHNWK